MISPIEDLLRTALDTSDARGVRIGLEQPLEILAPDHLEGGVSAGPPSVRG